MDATVEPLAVPDPATTSWVPIGPSAGLPVGAPIPWLTATIPSGYLELNGQAITQAAYPQLFALFGATLPDLRGMMMLGRSASYAVGSSGGEAAHTLSIAEMPAHGHNVYGPDGHSWGANFGSDQGPCVFGFNPDLVNSNGAYHNDPLAARNNGGGGSHNNLPPYRAVIWLTIAA